MQFVIQNSIVKATSLEKRTWLGRLWDRLCSIKRIPLNHDVEVAFYVPINCPAMPGSRILLANGTTWVITHFEQPWIFIGKSTEPLTTETIQQMQDFHGDAFVYAIMCTDDQEEHFFYRNPYV